ncbi:hypothetical protein Tco_0926330 [Tanacetum coccineum]|uniref:Reverse transcriptase Ty1/copia-type domain-containing protein n=1 Tax=Tanacetum coccineum TaxID=301880 RepID=A0ABQ5DCF3_9ASTR
MEDVIFFNQSKYIKEMLKKFGLEDPKLTKTPMSMEIKLTKDDEADSVDSFKYRGMIGSLLYLIASMPDILFSVCLCARLQENPKTTHLEAIKLLSVYLGAIDLSKNPVQYSRTKHIEIRYHFLRNNVQKGNISIEKIESEDNIADIFTKPLKREVFNYLRLGLGIMELIMDSDSPSSQK